MSEIKRAERFLNNALGETRKGLIDTSEVLHPKSNVVQNIQYYK